MDKRILAILATLMAALYGPQAVAAGTTQSIGNAWKLCDEQTARVEREEGIPRHLLKAIALAETGRWDAVEQESFAWPWTVTALGKGNYFPDKQAALDYVRALKGRGISNIDVGCMQINLFYHGDTFASLEQAIDPAANVDYAGHFLSGLYKTTRSWTQASGHYHSTTPERAKGYKMKVLKYWNQQRNEASSEDRKAVNWARMRELNANHKTQMAAALKTGTTDIRGGQLAAWRSPDAKGHDMATLATMRRIAKKAAWHDKYFGNANKNKAKAFASKRRKQLDKWRATFIATN